MAGSRYPAELSQGWPQQTKRHPRMPFFFSPAPAPPWPASPTHQPAHIHKHGTPQTSKQGEVACHTRPAKGWPQQTKRHPGCLFSFRPRRHHPGLPRRHTSLHTPTSTARPRQTNRARWLATLALLVAYVATAYFTPGPVRPSKPNDSNICCSASVRTPSATTPRPILCAILHTPFRNA